MLDPWNGKSGDPSARFNITEQDVGRYVRRKSTGSICQVSRDNGNGWLHPRGHEWRGYRDDLEYMDVILPNELHAPTWQRACEAMREVCAGVCEQLPPNVNSHFDWDAPDQGEIAYAIRALPLPPMPESGASDSKGN
jgi:hypothetical protein